MVTLLLDDTVLQLFFQLLPDLFPDVVMHRGIPDELLLRCFDKFRWRWGRRGPRDDPLDVSEHGGGYPSSVKTQVIQHVLLLR
jgi:hypothetical protein